MKSSGIGGQAVMEGIMMKNGSEYAVAIRLPNKEIHVHKASYTAPEKRPGFTRWPFIRGAFGFFDSLVVGMRTLSYSASFFEEEEPSKKEPSKFEQFLTKTFGDRLDKVMMGLAVFLSILLSVGLFMVLPTVLSSFLQGFTDNGFLIALSEGVLRIAIFIGYVVLISLMPDIKRVYMYHGAEHKCINCIEHGLPLTVENVAKSSKEHKRCGTSFMLFVMMISVLLFMLIRIDTLWLRVLSRIMLLPVIAGVSYEILRLAGNSDHPLVNFFSKPGLALQGLTTKQPDDSMIEVAIMAVEAVFSWKRYLNENFSANYDLSKEAEKEIDTSEESACSIAKP